MNCAGCGREMKEGDRYIEDTASGFLGIHDSPAGVDDLMAQVFGGSKTVLLCESCTQRGRGYDVKVYHEPQP